MRKLFSVHEHIDIGVQPIFLYASRLGHLRSLERVASEADSTNGQILRRLAGRELQLRSPARHAGRHVQRNILYWPRYSSSQLRSACLLAFPSRHVSFAVN